MRAAVLTAVILGSTLASTVASADEVPLAPVDDSRPAPPTPAPVAKPRPAPAERIDHKGQVLVSIRAALGYRAIATYDSAYCGDLDRDTSSGYAPVCTARSPFTFDVEVGFGVHRKLDAFLELRLGLEEDFGALPSSMAGPHLVKLSPGVRYYFSEGPTMKLFTTGQLVFDFTGYEDPAGADRGNDFGVRNLNGLWFDLRREYGIYTYFGETTSFARWFEFDLEVGVGIQGRYP